MKAKIDESGCLFIMRVGGWKKTGCPHDPEYQFCGDWCPLFEELAGDDLMVVLGCGNNARLIFIESDERQKNEKTDM